MKKLIYIFIFIFLQSILFAVDFNIENIFSIDNELRNNYDIEYINKLGNTVYFLLNNSDQNKFEKSISEKLLTKYDDIIAADLSNFGDFEKVLLNTDSEIRVSLYKKLVSFENIPDNSIKVINKTGKKLPAELVKLQIKDTYISNIVLETKTDKKLLWTDYSAMPNSKYLKDIKDIILSKDLNQCCMICQNSVGSFYLVNIKENEIYLIGLSPFYSFHTATLGIKNIRIWNKNCVRIEFENGTIRCYKIYQTNIDYVKNVKLNNKKRDFLIYTNDINLNVKSWDYSDSEPEFNLDGFYYNEIKDITKENSNFLNEPEAEQNSINNISKNTKRSLWQKIKLWYKNILLNITV